MTSETHGELVYDVDTAHLPPALAERFVRLRPDEGIASWQKRAAEQRAGSLRTVVHRFLRNFYLSDFDTNGLLRMYPMHLLSRKQFQSLVPDAGGSLLDVGAGSGDVTAELAPLFERIDTTEVSRMMARRLRERGFRCARIDLAEEPAPDPPYDVIACLNVLDRCAKPRSLLRALPSALAPGGTLVLSVPLPYRPLVYAGPATLEPDEPLRVESSTWELALVELVDREIAPAGWLVQSWSRVPYLSGGDSASATYELSSAVLVCGWGEP